MTLWILLPRLLARFLIPANRIPSAKGGASDHEQFITNALKCFDTGARLRLSRGRNWRESIAAMETSQRHFVLEGTGVGCGILISAAHLRWRELRRETLPESYAMRSAICRGAGIWAAKRYGSEVDQFLFAVRRLHAPELNDCVDGYGFKFGLFEFCEDRRKIAHLQNLPVPLRRSAFVGLGRAFYLLFMNNRRGLFEVAGDLSPDHDMDVMEGAGYCAGMVHVGELLRAVNFARSVPMEWRAHVHLGLTLALRDQKNLDAGNYSRNMNLLSSACVAEMDAAIAMADQLHDEIGTAHGAEAYYVWRDRLSARLQSSGIWESIHTEAMKASAGARHFGAQKEETR